MIKPDSEMPKNGWLILQLQEKQLSRRHSGVVSVNHWESYFSFFSFPLLFSLTFSFFLHSFRFPSLSSLRMAPNGLFCADVPLRNYSLTLPLEVEPLKSS